MSNSSEFGVQRLGVQNSKNKKRSHGTSYGFTLLEVLIAVAIMAGIVTVIYSSFFTASRNVEQAEAIRDSSDMARTLVAKIADDLSNAYYNPAMNRPEVITIFNGKKEQTDSTDEKSRRDSITLTTLTNWRSPNTKETDLWEVGYFFKQKPDGSGYVMMRREKRELSKDSPAGEGGIEYEITDRVKFFQLRYNEVGDTWYDEWNSTTRNRASEVGGNSINTRERHDLLNIR